MLLAAGNSGFGVLSNHLAFFIAIQDRWNCSGWSFFSS
jgi:hypothetical protein